MFFFKLNLSLSSKNRTKGYRYNSINHGNPSITIKQPWYLLLLHIKQ